VLEPLGAITSGSQFLEPDGNNFIYGNNFGWVRYLDFE
jgi:hypothetical protein